MVAYLWGRSAQEEFIPNDNGNGCIGKVTGSVTFRSFGIKNIYVDLPQSEERKENILLCQDPIDFRYKRLTQLFLITINPK